MTELHFTVIIHRRASDGDLGAVFRCASGDYRFKSDNDGNISLADYFASVGESALDLIFTINDRANNTGILFGDQNDQDFLWTSDSKFTPASSWPGNGDPHVTSVTPSADRTKLTVTYTGIAGQKRYHIYQFNMHIPGDATPYRLDPRIQNF